MSDPKPELWRIFQRFSFIPSDGDLRTRRMDRRGLIAAIRVLNTLPQCLPLNDEDADLLWDVLCKGSTRRTASIKWTDFFAILQQHVWIERSPRSPPPPEQDRSAPFVHKEESSGPLRNWQPNVPVPHSKQCCPHRRSETMMHKRDDDDAAPRLTCAPLPLPQECSRDRTPCYSKKFTMRPPELSVLGTTPPPSRQSSPPFRAHRNGGNVPLVSKGIPTLPKGQSATPVRNKFESASIAGQLEKTVSRNTRTPGPSESPQSSPFVLSSFAPRPLVITFPRAADAKCGGPRSPSFLRRGDTLFSPKIDEFRQPRFESKPERPRPPLKLPPSRKKPIVRRSMTPPTRAGRDPTKHGIFESSLDFV